MKLNEDIKDHAKFQYKHNMTKHLKLDLQGFNTTIAYPCRYALSASFYILQYFSSIHFIPPAVIATGGLPPSSQTPDRGQPSRIQSNLLTGQTQEDTVIDDPHTQNTLGTEGGHFSLY